MSATVPASGDQAAAVEALLGFDGPGDGGDGAEDEDEGAEAALVSMSAGDNGSPAVVREARIAPCRMRPRGSASKKRLSPGAIPSAARGTHALRPAVLPPLCCLGNTPDAKAGAHKSSVPCCRRHAPSATLHGVVPHRIPGFGKRKLAEPGAQLLAPPVARMLCGW